MGQRCPHSPLQTTGWLVGWRLTFGGEDLGWDGALSTIVEDPIEQVFVAVYDVSREDEADLDQWESTDTGLYSKVKLRVSTMTGELLAWTYVLDAFEGGLPSASYLGVIAEAAEAADAPDDYVAGLRLRPSRGPGPGGWRALASPPAPRLPQVTAQELAQEAADTLARLTGVERHDVALVLGSGWLPAAASLGEPAAEISSTDLPGFSAAAVKGHSGTIRSLEGGGGG